MKHYYLVLFLVACAAGLYFSAPTLAAQATTPGHGAKAALSRTLAEGSSGSDVKTMQAILIKDGDYPGGLVSGFFGKITKQAVIRFQEKYADEILRPNGLEHGNGVVGPSTRAKLNSLFDSQQSLTSGSADCLPAGIKLDDVVDARLANHGQTAGITVQRTTVAQKLAALNASCSSDNKLVDGNGREIYLYHLTGCWGNPPYNFQDILKKQNDELKSLKQHYTIIEMTCNPSGAMIQ